ncbi:MAG TPA: MFS transporter [Ktedonobacteraceae bacterium]|nr:MFS transporter [Ktedonobacteraceae bacterium]
MSDTSLQESVLPGLERPAPAAVMPWKRWSRAFDIHNLSTNTLFTSAIWMVYLAGRGYSPLALGLFEMLFHVAKFVTEVPTGIFADMLGRRKSLIVYCAITTVDTLLFLMPTPPLMVLSFLLAGTAYAFRGGASEAILWNIAGHADRANQSQRYGRLVSRMFMIGLIGEIVGTTTGGYLGSLLTILPFVLRSVFMLLGMLPLFFLPEQKIEASERTSALRHFGKGLQAVWRSPALMGLMLISGLTDSCWQTIYFFYQLYLHDLGFSLGAIGLIVAVSTASSFLFTAAAPYLMRWFSERWLIPAFVICEILGLVLMSLPNAWLGLLGYLVFFQASVAVLMPAISTYINMRSPEAQRATVLSLQTGLFSAAMIVLFPLFGLGVTQTSYNVVYIWTLIALASGALAVLGLVLLLQKVRSAR